MSGRPPRLDATALEQTMGGSAPGHLSRQGRVRLLGEAAADLLAGRLPSPEARQFLAAGLSSWLKDGSGDLCRDYWKVTGERGSHRTAGWVWQQISSSGGRQGDDEAAIVSAENTEIP